MKIINEIKNSIGNLHEYVDFPGSRGWLRSEVEGALRVRSTSRLKREELRMPNSPSTSLRSQPQHAASRAATCNCSVPL